MEKILEVKDLRVSFHTYAGEVQAVRGISFYLKKGETLAVVGESGCGKTVTSKSLMRLIPEPPGEIKEGSQILFDGKNISTMSEKELRELKRFRYIHDIPRSYDFFKSNYDYWKTNSRKFNYTQRYE